MPNPGDGRAAGDVPEEMTPETPPSPEKLRAVVDGYFWTGLAPKYLAKEALLSASAWEADIQKGANIATELARQLRTAEARIEALEKADELAWNIIANSQEWNVTDDGSPCGDKAKEWRMAATQWRDERHERLAALAAQVGG